MKERYSKPEMAPVDIYVEHALLDGSITNKPMTVNNVTVQDFDDGGFEELSFD